MGAVRFYERIRLSCANTLTERTLRILLSVCGGAERGARFDRLADAPRDENGQLQKKYDIIQPDGLAGVGERVDPGDVYINKQSPANANDHTFSGSGASAPYKNAPMTYKSPVAGHIDKVMLSDTENDQTLIKVLVRQTRRPELGDKFSSRHGQKGVCGLIVNQEDMPFNDQGIVPGTLSAPCP